MITVRQLINVVWRPYCARKKCSRTPLYFLFVTQIILTLWFRYNMAWTEKQLSSLAVNTSVIQTCEFNMTDPKQFGSTKTLGFIVGGVEKAGTSALDLYLRSHPYLALPEYKESRFFDRDTINWTSPNFTDYEYRGQSRDKLAIAGENTPNYIYWPNALERIRCYNPGMKLIFLFRQPVERAWSHWKMSFREKLETKPFSWVIREGRARLANITIHPGYHWVYSYVERGFYGQQLKRLLKLFPRKQLLLLLHEDLKANPTRILRQISQFLGVPELPGTVKQLKTNVAPKTDNEAVITEADAKYLQRLYHDDLKLFTRLSGLNITSWFRSRTLFNSTGN